MNAQIVSFRCVLKDRLGHVISSSYNQNVSTEQDPSGQLRGFTRGMQGLVVGECRRIYVAAEEAYGFYDLKKTVELTRDDLPPHKSLRVGDVVLMEIEGGKGARKSCRVIELAGDKVTLDWNHPLAGQDLIFEIEATDVRAATEEDDEEEDSIQAVQATSSSLH